MTKTAIALWAIVVLTGCSGPKNDGQGRRERRVLAHRNIA